MFAPHLQPPQQLRHTPQLVHTSVQLDQRLMQQQQPDLGQSTLYPQPTAQHQPSQLLPAFVQDFVARTASTTPVIPTPTVFLSRLAPTCSETQLTTLGSPYGTVKSARFVPKEGEGKSYGFIALGSPAQAQACILGLTEKGYKCGFARETLKEKLERLADPFETNLYVKNLPANYSQEALEHLFIPNVVVSSKMLESHNGGLEGKGVALVRLQTREEAHEMVDKLHGMILPGAAAPLVVRFADNSAQKVVREDAARAKKMSPCGGEGASSPESYLSTPQTQLHMPYSNGASPSPATTPLDSPASPPYISGFARLPQGFGINPYFTARVNIAQARMSQSPPSLMGSAHVAPFIPASHRIGGQPFDCSLEDMMGKMAMLPARPSTQVQHNMQLLSGMPPAGLAGPHFGVRPNVAGGLGLPPFGKELSHGGEEYGPLHW